MTKLLAIGTDTGWLGEVTVAARAAGAVVEVCASVSDAIESFARNGAAPSLVVVDADSCPVRADPALRALRGRIRVRFVLAFGPASESVARTLPCDAIVAKRDTVAALREELGSRR